MKNYLSKLRIYKKLPDPDSSHLPLLQQVRFRLIKQVDLPALEWEGEFIHFRRLYADVFHRSERGDGLMWAAEFAESKIIGQLFISLSTGIINSINGSKRAYIYGFRIRPEYRGQGIGSAMMRWVERDLVERGVKSVTLNVAQNNLDALRLYKRIGYQIVGYEAGEWSYVDHNGERQQVKEPAWRMEKQLYKS